MRAVAGEVPEFLIFQRKLRKLRTLNIEELLGKYLFSITTLIFANSYVYRALTGTIDEGLEYTRARRHSEASRMEGMSHSEAGGSGRRTSGGFHRGSTSSRPIMEHIKDYNGLLRWDHMTTCAPTDASGTDSDVYTLEHLAFHTDDLKKCRTQENVYAMAR